MSRNFGVGPYLVSDFVRYIGRLQQLHFSICRPGYLMNGAGIDLLKQAFRPLLQHINGDKSRCECQLPGYPSRLPYYDGLMLFVSSRWSKAY